MTKDKLKGLISLGLLITVIGFILLFFSVNSRWWGRHFNISNCN
ncbi:hypothetical protein SAMN05421832_12714 [Psychrobacillus psychrodurans]|nr:hypothetical protein SAMN05421832_12714 [Psychrobacillus psychrodurans]